MLLFGADEIVFVTCGDDLVSFTSLLAEAVTLSSDTQRIVKPYKPHQQPKYSFLTYSRITNKQANISGSSIWNKETHKNLYLPLYLSETRFRDHFKVTVELDHADPC